MPIEQSDFQTFESYNRFALASLIHEYYVKRKGPERETAIKNLYNTFRMWTPDFFPNNPVREALAAAPKEFLFAAGIADIIKEYDVDLAKRHHKNAGTDGPIATYVQGLI